MLNHYNLRLNPNFEEDVYVDDWFLAIEEEEKEEEEEAIDPPAGGGADINNNIGVDPPVGRDPPTGNRSPTDQPPTDQPPPDPPTVDDRRKKPRQSKQITLLNLINKRSKQFIKPTKYMLTRKTSDANCLFFNKYSVLNSLSSFLSITEARIVA